MGLCQNRSESSRESANSSNIQLNDFRKAASLSGLEAELQIRREYFLNVLKTQEDENENDINNDLDIAKSYDANSNFIGKSLLSKSSEISIEVSLESTIKLSEIENHIQAKSDVYATDKRTRNNLIQKELTVDLLIDVIKDSASLK